MVDMMIYFTSDLHLEHNNIIKYCNRPFADAKEMFDEFIRRWNSVVTDKDIVYVLGDFCVGDGKTCHSFFDQVNYKEVHLIKGNHDKSMKGSIKQRFTTVSDYKEIWIPNPDNPFGDEQLVVLCHYAFRVWNQSHRGSWNLYGHSHGATPGNSQQLDVGVDCWDYTPCSIPQIQQRLRTLPRFYQNKTD